MIILLYLFIKKVIMLKLIKRAISGTPYDSNSGITSIVNKVFNVMGKYPVVCEVIVNIARHIPMKIKSPIELKPTLYNSLPMRAMLFITNNRTTTI